MNEAPPQAPEMPRKMSTEERKAILAQQVANQVRDGARVESQQDFQVILVKGRRPNHLLHFLAGIFTLGLWWIVWIFITLAGGESRLVVSVDEYGHVLAQQ
jgi:hypothetical protein